MDFDTAFPQDGLARIEDSPVSERPSSQSEFRTAQLYLEIGDDQKALHHYFRGLLLDDGKSPQLFDVYKNMGNIYLRAGDSDAAEQNYYRAWAIQPDSPALYVNFGTLEIQRGQWGEALEFFRHAVQLDHDFDRAWVGLSLVHRQLGDFELAWGNLHKALDIYPYNRTALTILVEWAVRDMKLETAGDRLRIFLKEHPQDAAMTLLLAEILYCSAGYEQAQITLEQAKSLGAHPNKIYDLEERLQAELERIRRYKGN